MEADRTLLQRPEFTQSFLANERQVRIDTGKLACALVVVLMPLGAVLDYFVYPAKLGLFFELRLACSALVCVVWLLHWTRLAREHYLVVGLPIAILPSGSIALMMYLTEGAASPYYAGLNLIMLAVSAVGHWRMWESLLAVASVICPYLLAVAFRSPAPSQGGILFSNLYFLALTGLIVITGNYLFNRLRFREFALRFELDQNRLQLEETNRRLRELGEVKDRFFANISHELRTPLTLLLAPLETLLHPVGRAFDAQIQQLLTTMHSNGLRLLKLINDLLDLVRLESGRIEVRREALPLAEFLNGLGSAVRQVAQERGIQLAVEPEPALGVVLADRDKVEKIVLNLLFNALKFTPVGGRVQLQASREEEWLVVRVSDTGVGIAQEHLAHVFDRFWQADDSSRRKFQGAGIGLALVKELVEVQGGTVEVASQPGQGATFTVRLPYLQAQPAQAGDAAPASASPAPETGAASEPWLANLYRRAELFPASSVASEWLRPVDAAAGGQRPKLLVADDEPDMLRFLSMQLSPDYTVVEAVDGRQAVAAARESVPDIILLDMMMPEKDGLQVCKELRERAETQVVPIVLLTARADEETKLAVLSAGASDFLTKPFSTTELRVRLKNLVDSYQFQRKLARQKQLLESTLEQLKETESQLIQNEKLASLGRLSAGIIHEINNPLNFANTGLYALKKKTDLLPADQRESWAEVLKDVQEGLQRVQGIVGDLRSFSHQQNELIEPVAVEEVMGAALRFLSHQWRDQIEVVQAPCAGQRVGANRNKLIQVLVNLVQNAIDAVKYKEYPPGQGPAIRLEGRVEPGRSLIIVRDNGMGIDTAHLDKIFDPFFTTKEVGEGMGLGLSIVYRLVRDFGGQIRVRSEPGQFSEFTLEFPAGDPPVNDKA